MSTRRKSKQPKGFLQIDSDESTRLSDYSGKELDSGINTDHYVEIGRTLLEAENRFICVGIPLVITASKSPSPGRISLEEFLKESLVNINTKTLISYANDLQDTSPTITKTLHISISKTKRYFFPVIATLISAGAIISSLSYSGLEEPMAWIIGLFFSSFVGFASAETCRDIYRKNSFNGILQMEITRRQGGGDGKSRLNLSPVCE